MTVNDWDKCDGYPNSICHRIHVDLENILDIAGLAINPKSVVSVTIDFGDGRPNSVVSKSSATYRYREAGTYIITGTATDDDGATGTETRTVVIKSYPLVPPVVRLQPARRTASLDETILFNIYAYDPDQGRDGCIACPSPCPCPPCPCPPCPRPPCLPPCYPCEIKDIELKEYTGYTSLPRVLGVCGDESIEIKGICPQDNGIVRIRVAVINPSGVEAIYDTRYGTLNLANPTFKVKFNKYGDWKFSFIAWDDDCRHKATGYIHRVNVPIPDDC